MLFHSLDKASVLLGTQNVLHTFLKSIPEVFFRKIGTWCDLTVHCDEDAALDDPAGIGMFFGKV